ncbi:GPR1/FUN34/YaaH family transporter [Streptomyces sp. NPDC057428]|uniref:GPR1/FUN34/YaaH family transporter n=1 Tax=Streptomyces sp. NPDC057428 TaxID=3346129 RepID=UPI00368ED62F
MAAVKRPYIRIGNTPWALSRTIDAEVRHLTTPMLNGGKIAAAEHYYVHAALERLRPGTTYYYGVGHDGFDPADARNLGTLGTFTTAPARAESFTFTAFGDQGVSYHTHGNDQLILGQNPAFHLHAGDICYADPSGSGQSTDTYDARTWDQFLAQTETVSMTVPWMVTTGNHGTGAWYSPNGYGGQNARWTLPDNGPAPVHQPGAYFFTHGNVGVIALDTNDVPYEIPANSGPVRPYGRTGVLLQLSYQSRGGDTPSSCGGPKDLRPLPLNPAGGESTASRTGTRDAPQPGPYPATMPQTSDTPGPSEPLTTDAVTRIVLRPVASPLPLGFFALGIGSVVLSSLQLGWVPTGQSEMLLLLVLIFVVPLQFVAGLFVLLARDAGAGTALLLLAAAWAGTSVTSLDSPPGRPVVAQAVFLLALVPFVLALAGAAVPSKPLFAVLLTLTALRFGLTGLYEAGTGNALQVAAGWTGVVIGVYALYGGLALLVEDGKQRTVLPLFRRGAARRSIEGDLREQLTPAQQEAGVRHQL